MSYLNNTIVGNANLLTTAWDIGGAWLAFTPTLSWLFTDWDWSKTCYYTKIGKTIIARYFLKATDATPMGWAWAITVSLPTTAKTLWVAWAAVVCWQGYVYDASPATVYPGSVFLSETDLTTVNVRVSNAAWTYTVSTLSYSSTIPFTWTTNDEIGFQVVYEAA